MIRKKVTTELYRLWTEVYNRETDETTRTLGEITDEYIDTTNIPAGESEDKKFYTTVDCLELRYEFELFTNSGKLSKRDLEYTEELASFAEKALQEALQVEADLEKDMKRALELAEIVNNADFSEELRVVSTKTSKSKWYEGRLNTRSQYTNYVPASVVEEAKELHALRKKHHGNPDFDFEATKYKTVTERDADHQKMGQDWN